MAHQIEGNNAFFNKTPAWHELGYVLSQAPTPQEAWQMAYPHDIHLLPSSARIVTADGETQYIDQNKYRLVVRDDGKILGQVGERHTLVQPIDTFKWFEPLIDAGLVELESGGSLRNGSRMWALAKVKGAEADILKNDSVKAYYLIYDSFDGSLRRGCSMTNVRVVCANTLAMAMGDKHGIAIDSKFKHTASIHANLDALQSQVAQVLKGFVDQVEAYRTLAKTPCNDIQLETYVKQVFEIDDSEELSTRTENKIQYVLDLAQMLPDKELVPAARGTAWNAYNSVTHYLQHEAGRTNDSRVDSLWFGPNAATSQRALHLALAM